MYGIYRFYNKLTNESYVGQSVNLEERYKKHISRINKLKYQTDFYKAVREYGLENFKYEILYSSEYLTQEELNDKEKYYINFYNSYNSGYNMSKGGGTYKRDKNKLSKSQVKSIEYLLINTKKSYKEISNLYNIAESTVSLINAGKIWNNNLSYPLRKDKINNLGENNPNSKITDDLVMNIRKDFVYMSLKEIQDKYRKLCSMSELKKVCYGVQFKHLPIYKKRKKLWYLNGTCIDYPRLEE